METKIGTRQHLRTKLRAIPESVRQPAALQIWNRLRLDPGFQAATTIASFASMATEVDTRPIHVQGQQAGKIFAYPKVMGDREPLRFFVVHDLGELDDQGRILEPKPGQHAEVTDIQLFLVPGLGFTRAGGRLGHGKGYYDQTLSQSAFCTVPRYGLAFNEQILAALTLEPHDVMMTKVFTPDAVFLGKTI